MMKKPVAMKAPAEQFVKDIRRATRKLHSSEEKIRIVLSGLRGEDSAPFVTGAHVPVDGAFVAQ